MKNQAAPITVEDTERGFSIVEVLVSISILAVVGLSIASSTINSYVFLKRSFRSSLASQLALDKLELLATVNPDTLTTANNSTETNLKRDSVTFTRTTTITVNADNSRTVSVSVSSTSGSGGKASFTTTLPQWGNS